MPNAIEQIHFDGAQYRTDIGHLAIRLQGGDRANH